MAKQPTIRLKKTELPISPYEARQHADNEMAEFAVKTLEIFEKFHKYENGSNMQGTMLNFKTLFIERVLRNRYSAEIRLQEAGKNLAFRRIMDISSPGAPWAWKPLTSTVPKVETNTDKKVSTPVAFHQNSQSFDLMIDLTDKKLGWPGGPDFLPEEKEASQSRKFRALSRYVRMLDWQAIKQGLSVRFSIGMSDKANNENNVMTYFAVIKVKLATTYLSGSKYSPRSLLGDQAFATLPAVFDLETARALFEGKEVGNTKLEVRPFLGYHFYQPLGRTENIPPTTQWINDLVKNIRGTDEEIRSGKAPIPPAFEVITLLPLVDRMDDLKKIVRNILRIARPYDNISFLPTAG